MGETDKGTFANIFLSIYEHNETLFGYEVSPWGKLAIFLALGLIVFINAKIMNYRVETRDTRFAEFYTVVAHGLVLLGVFLFTPYITLATWELVQKRDTSFADVAATILMTLVYWSFVFHVLAYAFGYALTHLFGRNWVKCIDYLYLIGSTIGILRVAAGEIPLNSAGEINAAGVVTLGIALSLRLTKTSIEIFRWDELSDDEKLKRRLRRAQPPKRG